MPAKSSYECIRCGHIERSAAKFGGHLSGCSERIQLRLIYSSLGVTPGHEDKCWLVPWEQNRCPKIGLAPGESVRACHVVAHLVHGQIPDGLMLCHQCDDKRCLNPDHLYYGTSQDNARDAWRNGRRTMSRAQSLAMAEGLRRSPRHKARMTEHNRALAKKNSGANHWTKKNPDDMTRWKAAMAAGRRKKVMPHDQP